MKERINLASGQIVSLVESHTRYDRTSLAFESGVERVTAGKAYWRYNPAFSVEGSEHAGYLPSYVTRAASKTALEDAVKQARASALEALPSRIERWLRTNAPTDRKLEPPDCFDGPKTFGHEFDCRPCSGRGWVKCGTCDGNRLVTCGGCRGRGRKDCTKCSARAWVKCGMCRGKGKMSSGARCGTCGGRGKVVCPGCNGERQVTCTKCKGAGQLTCPGCKGTGTVTCSNCAGTGRRHTLQVLKCEVGDHFRVEPKDPKTEVSGLLRGLRLTELRALARVTQAAPAVDANVVLREYAFECDIAEVKLKAADTGLEFIGYGPRAQVFDFKSLLTLMLGADLRSLRQAVSATPRRLWGACPALLDATRRSLASEVNATQDAAHLIKVKAVTPEYVKEVKALLSVALEKLFLARAGLAVLATALVPTVLFVACHIAGVYAEIGAWIFAGPVVAAAGTWLLLERRAKRLMLTAFDAKAARRAGVVFKTGHVAWKPRGLALALTATLLVLAAFLP